MTNFIRFYWSYYIKVVKIGYAANSAQIIPNPVQRAEDRREKFYFCRLPFAVNVKLNLYIKEKTEGIVVVVVKLRQRAYLLFP